MKEPTEIFIIDAFTGQPFRGNPAAVCLLNRYPSDHRLQQVAMEMNQAETAFLCPSDDGGFRLRWFTPQAEVDLCGHATLASAHYLWQTGKVPKEQMISFHTLSGQLTAKSTADGWIELDFPAEKAADTAVPERLQAALRLEGEIRYVGRNRLDLLVELATEAEVRGLQPDYAIMAELDVRGVMVTAPSEDPRYDFVSRCFLPAVGINEDPVTGSAHCALAPYWKKKLGKERLTGIQLSDRTGVLRMQCAGNRVLISGLAVTVLQGSLLASGDEI